MIWLFFTLTNSSTASYMYFTYYAEIIDFTITSSTSLLPVPGKVGIIYCTGAGDMSGTKVILALGCLQNVLSVSEDLIIDLLAVYKTPATTAHTHTCAHARTHACTHTHTHRERANCFWKSSSVHLMALAHPFKEDGQAPPLCVPP